MEHKPNSEMDLGESSALHISFRKHVNNTSLDWEGLLQWHKKTINLAYLETCRHGELSSQTPGLGV